MTIRYSEQQFKNAVASSRSWRQVLSKLNLKEAGGNYKTIKQKAKAMGLETEVRTYDVWLPHATSVSVTRLGPDSLTLDLTEPPIPGDAPTALPQYLTVNGSSGAGTGSRLGNGSGHL